MEDVPELMDDLRRSLTVNGGETVPFLLTVRRPGRGDGGRVKMLCCPKAWEGNAAACERQLGGGIA